MPNTYSTLPGSKQPLARRRGFTLTELVVSIVILGVIAAIAAPRFISVKGFESRGFYDRAISVVRQAQKTAIAQRRTMFVVVTADRISACYDATCSTASQRVLMSSQFAFTPGMGSALTRCADDKNWLCAGRPDDIGLPTTTFITFDGLGRPSAATTINITSTIVDDPARNIVVEAETGYVHP